MQRLTLTVFLLLISPALAAPPDRPEMVVPPEARFTKNVLFLVDTSTSMNGNNRISRAISAFSFIAESSTDEMQFGVCAFGKRIRRWGGIPEEKFEVPPGWAARTPQAVERADEWLSRLPLQPRTEVIPGIEHCLSEDRDELTVVLITDGDFDFESRENVLKAIQSKQEEREHPAVLCTVGVGRPNVTSLREIAESSTGGLFLSPDPEDPKSEEDAPQLRVGPYGPPIPLPDTKDD